MKTSIKSALAVFTLFLLTLVCHAQPTGQPFSIAPGTNILTRTQSLGGYRVVTVSSTATGGGGFGTNSIPAVFTNWIANTLYTNNAGTSWKVGSDVQLITTGVAGKASMALVVISSTTTNTFEVKQGSLATSLADTNQIQISGPVNNGSWFYLTNTSTGGGDVATLVAGTGFYQTISGTNGAAGATGATGATGAQGPSGSSANAQMQFYFLGDSRTDDNGTPGVDNWTQQMMTNTWVRGLAGRNNLAKAGGQVTDAINNWSTNAVADNNFGYFTQNTNGTRWVFVYLGGNDNTGSNESTIESNFTNLWTKIKNANALVIQFPLFYQTNWSGAQLTEATNINAFISTNSLINIRITNLTTYASADGIHPTLAGSATIANAVLAQITNQISQFTTLPGFATTGEASFRSGSPMTKGLNGHGAIRAYDNIVLKEQAGLVYDGNNRVSAGLFFNKVDATLDSIDFYTYGANVLSIEQGGELQFGGASGRYIYAQDLYTANPEGNWSGKQGSMFLSPTNGHVWMRQVGSGYLNTGWRDLQDAANLSGSPTFANVTATGTYTGNGSGLTNLNLPDRRVIYGRIYLSTNFSSLSGFTNNGTTVSASGNTLNFSGGAGTFTQTLDYTNYFTELEKWKISATIIVGVKSATTYGIGLGIRSYNTNLLSNLSGRIDLSSAGTGGTLYINGGTANTQLAASSSSLSTTAGDTVLLTVERDRDEVIVTANNLTVSNSNVSVSYKFNTIVSANLLPNFGLFSVFNLGGTQSVASIEFSSKVQMNADVAFVGDSKSQGYYSTNYNAAFPQLFSSSYNSIVLAGGSDTTGYLLQRTNEVKVLSPKTIVLEIGCNDLRNGVAAATWKTNYINIVNAFQSYGIVVYHLLPLNEVSLDQSALTSFITSTYPGATIDSGQNHYTLATLLASDNIHPGPFFHYIINNAITSFYDNLGKYTYQTSPINSFVKNVIVDDVATFYSRTNGIIYPIGGFGNGSVYPSGGASFIWNSNGNIFLRTSRVGATNWQDTLQGSAP